MFSKIEKKSEKLDFLISSSFHEMNVFQPFSPKKWLTIIEILKAASRLQATDAPMSLNAFLIPQSLNTAFGVG